MNHLGSPFTQRRSEALRTGALLDITATAVATCMGMPSAVSPALWRGVADDDPCRAGDPRVMCLCWFVFLFVTSNAYEREERGPHHRIVWFEATVLGRRVAIKAIAHRDEHFEPVMTLLCADEPDPFSKWPRHRCLRPTLFSPLI
jgi:hypothetical protein